MRQTFASLALVALVALAAPATYAGDCDGTPGWHLHAPSEIAIGSTVEVCLYGPANEMALLMVSGGTSVLPSRYGNICVEFPLIGEFMVTLDASGEYCFEAEIDCDPSLVGLTVYSQFITCRPNKGVSNLVETTIVDGLCGGDLCTFTQGGWGTNCSGGNPGCRRDTYFDSVFPHGLTIGDADGIDGDGEFALHFSDSAAVAAFLPAGGKAGALNGDAHDPLGSSAGVFAGQLLAAKLNLAFDDAGALDDCKGRTELDLGDLVFVAGVDADLLGWSVREVIDLADQAISGALGSSIDLDGDGKADVTMGDLSDALDALNNNFDNGTSNLGYLGIE